MTIYYANSTNGFYNTDINSVIPTDAVEITEENYQELLNGQSAGQVITANAQGYPILTNRIIPIPTAEENKATASSLLTATDWTTIADVANPINSPYLTNQSDFITYRNIIRKIAVTPIEGNLVWADVPKSIWK